MVYPAVRGPEFHADSHLHQTTVQLGVRYAERRPFGLSVALAEVYSDDK